MCGPRGLDPVPMDGRKEGPAETIHEARSLGWSTGKLKSTPPTDAFRGGLNRGGVQTKVIGKSANAMASSAFMPMTSNGGGV